MTKKSSIWLYVFGFAATANAMAQAAPAVQNQLFRCPNNYYIGDRAEAERLGCKVVEGGNITIVAAPRTNATTAGRGSTGQPASTPARTDNTPEQRARDSDARAILEAELKKTEARQAELLREYNNGEPEKRGDEIRNHQKYLDRVAELKANISRADADIAGLKREIGRLGPAASSAPR